MLTVTAFVAGLVSLASCGDFSAPAGPPARAISADVAASLSRSGSASVPVLERDKPIGNNVSASATIGAAGGFLFLPDADFTLIVPRGAVKGATKFTVTAVPGKMVAYEFEPHGTTFAVPLTAIQLLKGTHAKGGKLDVATLYAGYFENRTATDAASGLATIREAFGLSVDGKLTLVSFPIAHFSGYLVATGRHMAEEE
jgi:hypothetical protein